MSEHTGMPYSVELFFDPVTSQAVGAAWRDLALPARGDYMVRNGVYPHVALAVLEDGVDVARLRAALSDLAERLPSLSLEFQKVGCFPNTAGAVYLGFEKNAALGVAHSQVAMVLEQVGLTNHELYRADMWVPHCTLAMYCQNHCEEVSGAAGQRDWNLPFIAEKLALVQHPPTALLDSWPLRGPSL